MLSFLLNAMLQDITKVCLVSFFLFKVLTCRPGDFFFFFLIRRERESTERKEEILSEFSGRARPVPFKSVKVRFLLPLIRGPMGVLQK